MKNTYNISIVVINLIDTIQNRFGVSRPMAMKEVVRILKHLSKEDLAKYITVVK